MKFDFNAYDELFPRQEEKEVIESAVSTFNPTAENIEKEEKAVEVGESSADKNLDLDNQIGEENE